MRKFWNMAVEENGENVIRINGEIGEDFWSMIMGEERVTGRVFLEDLTQFAGKPVTVWINSPGGNVIDAYQIYTALREHKAKVTVKIDGLAASAGSIIAVAGDVVLMSPTSVIVIHNPMTWAEGDTGKMQKAIETLNAVKEGVINAYALKTKLPRNEISRMMDNEKWMEPAEAVKLGFADGILPGKAPEPNMWNGIIDGARLVYNSITRGRPRGLAADLPDHAGGESATELHQTVNETGNATGGGKVYAIDFDGTLVEGMYPQIGKIKEKAFSWAKDLRANGDTLILWTCRNGKLLDEAVEFCRDNGLEFDFANQNCADSISKYGSDTRKVSADYYVDNKNLAIPEILDNCGGAEPVSGGDCPPEARAALEMEKLRYGGMSDEKSGV